MTLKLTCNKNNDSNTLYNFVIVKLYTDKIITARICYICVMFCYAVVVVDITQANCALKCLHRAVFALFLHARNC